jgi:hypothetical protein
MISALHVPEDMVPREVIFPCTALGRVCESEGTDAAEVMRTEFAAASVT